MGEAAKTVCYGISWLVEERDRFKTRARSTVLK